MENEKLLPKPELDLPLPRLAEASAKRAEKELPSHSGLASKGHALQNQKTNIFKNKFFILFIAISFLIAFAVGGFVLGKTQNTINLTEEDDGKITSVNIGELINITLPNPGDGGYKFTELIYDKKLLSKIDNTHTPPTSDLPGDFGKDIWTFKTIETGEAQIKFNIAASFNPADIQPRYIFNLDIK